MFPFFKKRKEDKKEEEQQESSSSSQNMGQKASVNHAVQQSAMHSSEAARKKYYKPEKYDRSLYDSGPAKYQAKKNAFANGPAKDPYTGQELELRKQDAKLKNGDKWTEHLAEADHTTPLKKIHNQNKHKAFVTQEDLKEIANSQDNLQVTNRKFNNAKRDRTNKELVEDDEYLKKTRLDLTEEQKKKAIDIGKESEKKIRKKVAVKNVKGAVETFHQSGKAATVESGKYAAVYSTLNNTLALIKGEKTLGEAVSDTASGTTKALAKGYVQGGGMTVLNQALCSSKSNFLQSLGKCQVPAKVITAITVTGDSISRYLKGEITGEECITSIGKNGAAMITSTYTGAIGQALIPIPVVGYTVGAFIGYQLTEGIFGSLIQELENDRLEHEERMFLQQQADAMREEANRYRQELENYLDNYYGEYKHCFDEALGKIHAAYAAGDANGVIGGANQITRKLGGTVRYETVDEFRSFLSDDSTDSF